MRRPQTSKNVGLKYRKMAFPVESPSEEMFSATRAGEALAGIEKALTGGSSYATILKARSTIGSREPVSKKLNHGSK